MITRPYGISVLPLCLALAGCGETAPAPASGSTAVPLPSALRSVDRGTLVLRGSVNGEPFTIRGGGTVPGAWSFSRTVAPGEPVELSLTWLDERDGELVLATLSGTYPAADEGRQYPVRESDYDYGHDADADGYLNVAELVCGTGAREADGPGAHDGCQDTVQVAVDVEINLARAGVPEIDGRYDGDLWLDASFRDVDDRTLAIDVPMIVQDAGPLDPRPGYRWFALHDGATLYVYVEGKPAGSPVFADSPDTPWNDDTLNLFIDGDDSKGQDYDGVNDFQVFMPLARRSESSGLVENGTGGRVSAGENSRPLPPGLRFATCLCTNGRHIWELSVPLAEAGIDPGRPFGIELQIDEDNDGGGRDARFGWAHPARQGGQDTDLTWQSPFYMGTARLVF